MKETTMYENGRIFVTKFHIDCSYYYHSHILLRYSLFTQFDSNIELKENDVITCAKAIQTMPCKI